MHRSHARCAANRTAARMYPSPLAATIGEDIREQKRVWRTQTACTTVTESQPRERITAYRVTYRYRGHTKTTRLSYHPGERIPVNVRVSPLL